VAHQYLQVRRAVYQAKNRLDTFSLRGGGYLYIQQESLQLAIIVPSSTV
jgi:hypothetical protein